MEWKYRLFDLKWYVLIEFGLFVLVPLLGRYLLGTEADAFVRFVLLAYVSPITLLALSVTITIREGFWWGYLAVFVVLFWAALLSFYDETASGYLFSSISAVGCGGGMGHIIRKIIERQ